MKTTLIVLLCLGLICYAITFSLYRQSENRNAGQQRATHNALNALQEAVGRIRHLRTRHAADSTRHVADSLSLAGYRRAVRLGVNRQPVVVLN